MPSNNESIHWDPTDEQLGLSSCFESGPTHERLKDAGYLWFASDGFSVNGRWINLYRKDGLNRWFLCLNDRQGNILASALCYSSSTLSAVVAEFKTIAEVL